VRQRGDHDVDPVERRRVVPVEGETRVRRRERRVELGDRRARVGVGGDVHDVDLGMRGQEAQELRAGVARAAQDRRSIRHGAYHT
jgi:hypothetical protein